MASKSVAMDAATQIESLQDQLRQAEQALIEANIKIGVLETRLEEERIRCGQLRVQAIKNKAYYTDMQRSVASAVEILYRHADIPGEVEGGG